MIEINEYNNNTPTRLNENDHQFGGSGGRSYNYVSYRSSIPHFE